MQHAQRGLAVRDIILMKQSAKIMIPTDCKSVKKYFVIN